MAIFARMNLVIDLGNTSAKFSVFNQGELMDVSQFKIGKGLSLKIIHDKLKDFQNITACILCSVIDHPIEIDDYLQQTYPRFIKFSQKTKVPIENSYGTVETLGLDRLAAAVGANVLFPQQNILVVDFGTCIKYDIVSNATYLGGSIAPGMLMRYRALNEFTDRLPLIQPKENIVPTGKSTEESILSGVQFGIGSEVQGIINHYKEQYTDLKIVFTGGDAKYFDSVPKNNIFAAPNLVSRGLNEVLRYNEQLQN